MRSKLLNRFPHEKLPSLYQGGRTYDLSESTTRDLRLGELIDMIGLDLIRNLPLGYAAHGEGDVALRQAIAPLVKLSAEQVVTTQGAAFGLYLAAGALGQPGSKALIHAPYFQLTYNGLKRFDWEVIVVQNHFDDRYRLNLEEIEAALVPDLRLITIASPQNPSGVSFPLEDMQALLMLMARKAPEALLFVDETYREAAYTMDTILPSAASLGQNVITCGSVSKAYGAPDLRVGWLTVPDESVRQAIISAKENSVIRDSRLTEVLAIALLEHREMILAAQQQHLARPLALVKAWQAEEKAFVDWVEPDAGALCCMRLNRDRFDEARITRFWETLAELDTLVRPGLLFGSDTRHFRLGFGHLPYDLLEIGLANLSRALRV